MSSTHVDSFADPDNALATDLDTVGGKGLSLLGGTKETALAALRAANEGWLPGYMGGV